MFVKNIRFATFTRFCDKIGVENRNNQKFKSYILNYHESRGKNDREAGYCHPLFG